MPPHVLLLAENDRHRIDRGRNSNTIRELHAADQESLPQTEQFLIAPGNPAILLGTDTEANPIDHLLHALAGSLSAVLRSSRAHGRA